MSHFRFILCFLKLGLGYQFGGGKFTEVMLCSHCILLSGKRFCFVSCWGSPMTLLDLVVTRRTQRTQHVQSHSQLKFVSPHWEKPFWCFDEHIFLCICIPQPTYVQTDFRVFLQDKLCVSPRKDTNTEITYFPLGWSSSPSDILQCDIGQVFLDLTWISWFLRSLSSLKVCSF